MGDGGGYLGSGGRRGSSGGVREVEIVVGAVVAVADNILQIRLTILV